MIEFAREIEREHGITGATSGLDAQLAGRIDEIAALFGSLREAADILQIDAGYLSRLRSGEKTEPSDEVLRKLGLRRVVSYERVPQRPAAATPLIRRTRAG